MTTQTQFKTNIIERYKNGESSYQISKNEECSYNTVLRELKRRGVNTGARFWAKEEIERLKELYSITSSKELLKEFPNRTKETIWSIASNLGLKKKECKKTCKGCGKEFTIKLRRKYGYRKGLCSKCVKKQWEHNNLDRGKKRKKQWIQRNPEYMNQYYKQLRRENPKFRLDVNMGAAIYLALKEKKGGRRWEVLVDYTLKDLIEHLESQFYDKINWDNYGSYWHVDHILPRSSFQYNSPDDPEFKKCWSLENLQPLEKSANFRKNNKILQNNSVIGSQILRHIL